ncbi:Cyclodehydratase OS=Streptomyces rutgersensis OX=53451 GN=F0345_27425 PE=4 SV=1 [Streptomyces diastaticus subsp. diastaticus]
MRCPGELDVAVGGTGSGTAVAGGLTNTAAVPAGEAVVLEGGTATVTAPAPGDVTFTPSDLRLNMLGLDVLCTPDETVAPAATTRVTAS